MYTRKGEPWVFKGVKNVYDCSSAEQVMDKAGLNWKVDKCPIQAVMGDDFAPAFETVPEYYATYRTDKNIPLGIVKRKYECVQNTDAFKFFDKAIGKNKAIYQTAGVLDNGKRVFISCKLPETILVHGDPIDDYLVFTTSHDGSSGVKILFSPIRVACFNMLNSAIRHSSSYITFKHTKSVHDNLDIADQILGICDQKSLELKQLYSELFEKKITDTQAQDAIVDLILTENEKKLLIETGHSSKDLILRNYQAIEDSQISTRKVNLVSSIHDYYHYGIAQREILGTAWGVYNAVSGYYSNVDNAIGEKRMDSLLYGDKANKIHTVGEYLLNL